MLVRLRIAWRAIRARCFAHTVGPLTLRPPPPPCGTEPDRPVRGETARG
ncbi:hypothetical protein AB0C65_07440 [Nocardia sp. NPDC048505]